MCAPLRRVVVRAPGEAFGNADPERWHYVSQPDLDIAQTEHADLVGLLEQAGAEVQFHTVELDDHADAIFVFDPLLITPHGAVVLSLGKPLRRGEEDALARTVEALGVPILFRLTGEARAEGGDLLWLDASTLAVGQGFRTNRAGLEQLSAGLAPYGIEVVPVELPYFEGRDACLHLLSLISILDHDLAVVYTRLLPVSFWRRLRDRGFELVEIAEEEFVTQASNVLALAPRQVVMIEGNPKTRANLEQAGCTVQTYVANELSLKAEGGPTCLTLPIDRRH